MNRRVRDHGVRLHRLGGRLLDLDVRDIESVGHTESHQLVGPSGTGVRGDEVKLVRSLGPVLVTVPNVRSMGVRAAQKVMKDAGFDTKVQPVSINYIGVGFVVFTNPRAGGQAQKGSTITLYVV